MIARLMLWDTIGAFLTVPHWKPKAPALCPGLSLFSVNRFSVNRRAPNRPQAPALVKWSWRPFWGCRRYDKSRPVASPRRVGALTPLIYRNGNARYLQ